MIPSSQSVSTLVDLLTFRAETSPEAIAYIFVKDGHSEGLTVTYAELHRQARNIAVSLRENVQPGSRVLINHLPGLDYIASFFGCLYASTIAIPVYPPRFNQKLDRLNTIALDAEPGAALTSKSVLENMKPLLASEVGCLKNLRWIESDTCKILNREAEWTRPDIGAETLAFMQYTSGSTSEPKGVMLSHLNILSNARCISEKFELTDQDRGMVWLPPYHDMGLIGGILTPMYFGFTAILMSPYTFLQRPINWLQAVVKYKATITGAPNFAFDLCAHRIQEEKLKELDLSSLRLMFCGAEPIRASVLNNFAEKFKPAGFRAEAFYPCYGLAEATLIVTGPKAFTGAQVLEVESDALDSGIAKKPSQSPVRVRPLVACGNAPSGHKVKIINPETLMECQDGHIGEIWFSGPSVAQGYWKRPELSERALNATIIGQESLGGFLRTGDLGFVSEGQVYVTGRIKDLLIIRGKNFYPQDIEHTVEKSHPGLKPGAVAAFSVLDDEEEKLVIVQELDRSARDADLQELTKAIRENVFTHHGLHPYAVSLIKTNSIPVTSSGKIQRHAARKQFMHGELQEKYRDVEVNA